MKANNTDTKYTALISSLATAKTSIENSNSIKEIQSTLDAILVAMKDVDTAMADLETKKQEAIDELQEYVDVLNDVEGLDSDDITKIKNFVKQAKDAVNAANSETEIGEAQETFEVLMTQYQEVGVEKAKQKAIATLNEHRDASKPAMEKLIDDTIADIEKLDDADQIGTKLEQALAKIDPLEVAQKGAYETLEAYENYLAENTVEGEDLILGEIETVKALIDNAADETSVTSAISGFNTFMETYKSVVNAVELQVATDKLEEKYQEVITKLNPYLANSNENVKPLADAALKAIDDVRKEAKEANDKDAIDTATTKIGELFYGKSGKTVPALKENTCIKVDDVTKKENDKNFVGYEAALKHNVEVLDKNDKEDKAARAEAYENATKKLDLYEAVLKNETAVSTLKLNAEDISRIQEMIDATRSSIAKATGANGIDSAMNLLSDGSTGYLDKYYDEYVKYASQYEFINTKKTALSKLNEYKETYKDHETLPDIIDAAITEIDGYKQSNKTVKDITDKLNDVEKTIDFENKKPIFDAEETRIINKYREVLADDKASASVKGIAAEAISKVNAVTFDDKEDLENFDDKMKALKDLETKYDEQLKDTLADIADQKQKDYQDALKVAMEKVNEYVTISENAKRTAVVNQLNNYKKLINDATDEEGVLAAEEQLDNYIANSCAVLKLQYDAIMNLNALVENDYSKDAEIKVIIDEGIDAIRKINVTDWSDTKTMTTEIEKIAKFEENSLTAGSVKEEIDEITTARRTLTSAKESAKNEIDELITEEVKKDSSIEADLNNLVKDYKDQIDAVTSDDEKHTKINGIKEKALQAIKGYMEGKIASSKEPVDTKLNDESSLESEFGGSITFSNMQTGVEATKLETPTKGYDEEYTVSGTLNKTEEFTWFNKSNTTEQSGNYLSMKFVNKYAGKITCELTNSQSKKGEITLDEDGIFIARITDEKTQTIIVRYYDSKEDKTPAKTVLYTLAELECKSVKD